METMFLDEHTQLKKWLKLKKTTVKRACYMSFFERNLSDFLIFVLIPCF